MRKRLNARQEQLIGKTKETFGSTLFVKHEELARLRHREEFPTNEARLCNSLVERASKALHDVVSIMENMPDTYVAKLLTSDEFQSLFYRTMLHVSAVDNKKPDAKLATEKGEGAKLAIVRQPGKAPYSIQMAATMFDYSLQTIIGSMPQDFHRSLKQQIFPFLMLVNAIANFQSSQAGKRAPRYNISFELDPDFPRNMFR